MRTITPLLAAWLWLLPVAPVAAAEPSPPTPEAAEPAPPSAIPVAEIVARADAQRERLAFFSARVSDAELERGAEERLEELEPELESAQSRLEATLSRRHAPNELRSLEAAWSGLFERLEREEVAFGERASQLDAWIVELRALTEQWKLTRTAAREAGAPQGVLTLVRELLGDLERVGGELRASRNAALELQGRVAQKQRACELALEGLAVARANLAASLFEIQGHPLWRADFTTASLARELEGARRGLMELAGEVADHVSFHRERFALHVILVLWLAWALGRARRFLRQRAAGEAAEPQSALGDAPEHPWATALLFGAIGTVFLYPDLVFGFRVAIVLVSLPAWVLTLGAMLPPTWRPLLVGFVLLGLVDIARLAGRQLEVIAQILLVLEHGIALAGTLWLRRTGRLRRGPANLLRSAWFRLFDGWVRVASVAFGVGLLAALLGYANLADRLLLLWLWGSYFGGGLLVGVRAVEALGRSAVLAGWLDRSRMARADRARILTGLRRSTRALGFLAWAYALLGAAQIWEPVRDSAGSVFAARLEYGSFALSLGGLVAFVLTLWISWLVARFVSAALQQEVFARVRTPPGVPFALTSFSRYAILVVGFVVALATLGLSFDRVALMLSALGVGIGFGLQNVVNNFVSGAILLFERPLRVGDRVQLDDLLGVITTIGIRASRIRTFDGADVIVPNGDLLAARVVNWTLSDTKRRVIVPVGVAYGTKPRQVLEILEKVARDNPEVLDHPAPEMLFRGFGDSSLDFELRVFTASERGWFLVMSDLGVAISEALEAAGIQIPFPQRDLHLRNPKEVGEALLEAMQGDPRGGRSGDGGDHGS